MPAMPELHESLTKLFVELLDGPSEGSAFVLNQGDPGLLRSLERIDAQAASTRPTSGGASIAAHVDHVCYGLELMNRWSRGEPNPWASADWLASWRRGVVTDEEWSALRERLERAAREYVAVLGTPAELPEVARTGMMGGVAHLAYHLGAMRQINRTLRGPSENEQAAPEDQLVVGL